MNITFNELKSVDLEGPFNFGSFEFQVWIDDDQHYHLHPHKNYNFEDSQGVLMAAPDVFKKTAPCCLKASRVRVPIAKQIVPVSVLGLMSHRQTLIDIISPLQYYQPGTALEAFDAVQDAVCNCKWPTVKMSECITTAWKKPFLDEVGKHIKRFKTVFEEGDQQAFRAHIAQGALSLFPKSTNPEIKLIFEKAKLEAISILASSSVFVIGEIPSALSDHQTMKTIKELYHVGSRNLIKVPEAVFELLKSSIRPSARSQEDVSDRAIEALDVLYQPSSDGPYSNLLAALEAAKAL